MGHSRPLFLFIFDFSIQLTVGKQLNVRYKSLPMTGFESQTSDATALQTEPQPLPIKHRRFLLDSTMERYRSGIGTERNRTVKDR